MKTSKTIVKAQTDLTIKYKLANELNLGGKFGILFQIPKRNAAYEELQDAQGPPIVYRYSAK